MFHKLLDALFPNFTCTSCGCEITKSQNKYLCEKCMTELPFNPDTENKKHFAPFLYAEPIRKMILSLKYSDNGLVARAVAPYMSAVFIKKCPKTYGGYIIIPIPLCRSRLHERGYNQSELLSAEIANFLDLPVLTNVLIRSKRTLPQKVMTPAQRTENLKNAFAVKNANLITDRNILLVDDVYTTGATAGECKRTLQRAGAKQVKILTIAAVLPKTAAN